MGDYGWQSLGAENQVWTGGKEAKMSGRDRFLFVSSNQRLSEDDEKSGKNNDMPDQRCTVGITGVDQSHPTGPTLKRRQSVAK